MDPTRQPFSLHAPSYQRLRDEALIEAEALRHQAIDDFWRGAGAVLATGASHSLRAARRLVARLRRRAGPPACGQRSCPQA